MDKFTPGPWQVRRWNPDDPEGWPTDRTSISDGHEALFINARFARNVEANANLIAAAPDLLYELESRYSQTKCGCGHPSCSRCEDDKETEKVLAKARGE